MESTKSQAGKSTTDLQDEALPLVETEPNGDTKQQDTLRKLLKQEQTRCIICLEDWVFDDKEEQKLSQEKENQQNQANFSDLWNFDNKPQEIINRLIPCNHFECNSCFVNYHQKTGKLNCPVCQKAITSYSIINSSTLTESTGFPVSEFADTTPNPENSGQLFESFDHQYFEHEITKLIQLRTTVEHERFHSRRNFSGNVNQEMEWQSLKQIEQRLFDIQEDIYMIEFFDSEQRMREVHELHETLVLIKAGKFMSDEDEKIDLFGSKPFDFNAFDDDLNDEHYDVDIKIKGKSAKASKQLMDPIQYMLDGGAPKKTTNGGSKKQYKKNRKGKGKLMLEEIQV